MLICLLWFHDHRKNIEVFNLPPYSPELNAIETLWHHTSVTVQDILGISIRPILGEMIG